MSSGPAWLQRPPPSLSAADAERAAHELWGVEAHARRLYAERDLNFRLDAADGRRWLLKISHPDVTEEALAFQHRVLRFLGAQHPSLPVPRPLADRDGNTIAHWRGHGGPPLRLQVQSWLEGEHRKLARLDAPAREALGDVLGRLDQALGTAPADGAPGDQPWDLQNFAALAPLAADLEGGELAQAARERLQRFRDTWSPVLRELPKQPIHGDVNSGNVLFEAGGAARVSGIVDFGDMVLAPRLCELAVACAYHLSADGRDPVTELAPLVRAYHRRLPLREEELALLPALVECRLVTTLLIQGWRARHATDHASDHEATAQEAATRLRRMAARGSAAVTEGLRAACSEAAPGQKP